MDFNSVSIMGRLTQEPKSFDAKDGKNRVEFAIANNKNNEQVNYFDCVVFGKTADIFNVLEIKKGDQVIVHGAIRTSAYEKDQTKKISISIDVHRIHLIQRKTVIKKQAVMAG